MSARGVLAVAPQISHSSSRWIPTPPGEQRRGVPPRSGFTIAEHDDDDVTTRSRTAANQAVPSRFRVAGFHAVAIREPFQDFVGVLKFAGATVGVTKDNLRQTNDRANSRIG